MDYAHGRRAPRSGQGHHRTGWQRNRRQHALERLEMYRQSERSDDRVVVDYRIAQHDRVHIVAGLAQHRADQSLPRRRYAPQERRVQESFDFRVRLPRPRHRSAVEVRDQRVVQQLVASIEKRQQHFGRRVRIECAHPGMPRRRRCHRIRRLEVAIDIDSDGRRHRPGLGRELTQVLVIGQARSVANRQVDENGQNRDGEKNLASQRLGQAVEASAANPISLS